MVTNLPKQRGLSPASGAIQDVSDAVITLTTPGFEQTGGIMNRPLLFLDVDGTLTPRAAKPEKRPHGVTSGRSPRVQVNVPPPPKLSCLVHPSPNAAPLASH